MDYTGLGLIILILGYGVLGYQRREQLHREFIRYLMQGIKPPERTARMEAWRLGTNTFLGLAALGACGYFAILGIQYLRKTPAPLIVAFCLAGIVVLLIRMIVRDLNNYRELRKTAEEVLL